MNCGQQLPAEAKFCFACGQRVETGSYQDAAGSVPETASIQQGDVGSQTESGVQLTLMEFREQAASQTGFRKPLLVYRKSLPNNWDYNAFVGILLGVGGPKHGDAACMNFAIGQGDNGNNTKKTLEARGLMSVFEKYRGKKISPSILLSDVEEEIISTAPDYEAIRKTFHEIVFAKTGGNGGAAETAVAEVTVEATAALPHKNVAPAPEDAPHTESAMAEREDVSEIIYFFVEVLARSVLAFLKNDIAVPDNIWDKFHKWKVKIWVKNQQEFEAYFGTSEEAKWLYSACSVVRNSITNTFDRPGYSKYFIDKAVSLLQRLPEGKYGIAYYALARCYGVGIDTLIKGIGKDVDRVYALRPDFAKMIEYLQKAAEAEKPEKEAFIDFGCVNLSKGDYQRARRAFELARECGEKADIYLRYIECCEHAVPAINGQQMTDDRNQYIYGNVVEYKNRIYWMCEDKQQSGFGNKTIMLCSMGADRKRKVLMTSTKSQNFIETLPFSASSAGLYFSICNDLIYYINGSGWICTMRLDGSDQKELTGLPNNFRKSFCMPMAFPKFLLFMDCNGQLWKRDQNGVNTKIKKVGGIPAIAGVSEREINIENEELIDLRTLEKQPVTKKYPALKKKTVFYIDMAREIAYYEENVDTGDTRDRRLIGVNTRGEMVDYWEFPLAPHTLPGYGHSSFCFNGQRLSVKMELIEDLASTESWKTYAELRQGLSEREWPFVALFDRRGNRQLLHEHKQIDGRGIFGGFHMMTENGIVILEYHQESGYWSTYYPVVPKGGIPPAKLDFFTS